MPLVVRIENKFSRRRQILGKLDAGARQQFERRIEESPLAKGNHKHSFTALPDLRRRSAFSKSDSTSTAAASRSLRSSVGVTICSRRSRLNEKPTAGKSSPNAAGRPSYLPPLATSNPRSRTYARKRMPV